MAIKLKIRLDETFPGHTQKKIHCPACHKPKRFVQFFDFEKEEYLPSQYGRCDRQEHCGYYLAPYADSDLNPSFTKHETIQVPENPIVYVDKIVLSKTLSSYESNTFVQFLISKVGFDKAMQTVYKMYIGTAKNNGTIFWLIDQFNKPRTGQKIHYDNTGHRIKDIEPKRLFMLKDGYKPCLFGEHQILNAPKNAIFMIVESEKTATVAECYMNTLKNRPLIWLACSGLNGLSFDKIQPLRGKEVCLVSDFSFAARATWGAIEMRKKENDKGVMSIDPDGEVVEYISAKDRLESIGCVVKFFDPAPELNDGSDIADLFLSEQAPGPEPEPKYKAPDFSSLKINTGESNLKPRTVEEEISIRSLLSGRSGMTFKIENGVVKCQMTNIVAQRKMDEYFNEHENLVSLINRFDLVGRSVMPL